MFTLPFFLNFRPGHAAMIFCFKPRSLFLGNTFPKDFCVTNRLAVAPGCRQFLADICTQSRTLAESSSCAGAADEITYLQCVGDPMICRAKICDKRVTNKDFCPPLV